MKRLILAVALLAGVGQVHAADLAGVLASQGKFSKLMEAAKAAGLDGLMHKPGPYTLFAPTDAAFQAMPPAKLAALMRPESKAELAKVLGFHMVIGKVEAKDWKGRTVAVKSTIGMPLVIKGEMDPASVNDAGIAQSDVGADNGVIHAIDHVLTPAMPIVPRT